MQTPGAFLTPAAHVQLSNRTARDLDIDPSPSATVSWKFNLNGTLEKDEGGDATVFTFEWWSAGSTVNKGLSYDVRCKEVLSGPSFTAEGANIGTYVQISAQRVWTLAQTVPPGDSIVATFQLVATGDTAVLAEADLTFTAIAESGA